MPLRKPTALIVDDDETDRFLLEWGFQRAGVANPRQYVSSGAEAMDYLLGHGKYADREAFPFPAIVVTDYEMPEMNGMELCQWIKTKTDWDIPVVVVIGSGWDREIERAYKAGANFARHKTSHVKELAEEIMTVWQNSEERIPNPLSLVSCDT